MSGVLDLFRPLWTAVQQVQAFRETHGPTYVSVLEVITGVALIVMFAWWAGLYFFEGLVPAP